MTLAIATNSADKISGIKDAFSRFFQIGATEVEVFNCSVNSGVPDQPFDEETYIGAMNRVNSLICSKNADFYVASEAGIEGFLGNYFNVQVVCIFEKKSQKYLFGKSSGWQIPSQDIEIIQKSNLDNYLKGKGIASIDELLGADYSRSKAIAQATELALLSKPLNTPN